MDGSVVAIDNVNATHVSSLVAVNIRRLCLSEGVLVFYLLRTMSHSQSFLVRSRHPLFLSASWVLEILGRTKASFPLNCAGGRWDDSALCEQNEEEQQMMMFAQTVVPLSLLSLWWVRESRALWVARGERGGGESAQLLHGQHQLQPKAPTSSTAKGKVWEARQDGGRRRSGVVWRLWDSHSRELEVSQCRTLSITPLIDRSLPRQLWWSLAPVMVIFWSY